MKYEIFFNYLKRNILLNERDQFERGFIQTGCSSQGNEYAIDICGLLETLK